MSMFHSRTLPSDAFPIRSSQLYSVSEPQDTYIRTYMCDLYVLKHKEASIAKSMLMRSGLVINGVHVYCTLHRGDMS